MRNFLKTIIEAALSAQLIKFSQREILADENTREIGFLTLNYAPAKGSFLTVEKVNQKGETYFKLYEVYNTTLVLLMDGTKEGIVYLKYRGIQNN